MYTLLVFFVVFLCILQVLMLFYTVFAYFFVRVYSESRRFTNTVSILLPVRNEAHCLRRCLDSLEALDFPTSQLEILIGNDASTDESEKIIKEYVEKYHHFKQVDIVANYHGLKGKANVLAQLAKKAKGQFLLITDADIEVNMWWAKGMTYYFENVNCGMVSGITATQTFGILGKFQYMEWLFYSGLINVTDKFSSQVAVGNNMAIRRSVYEEIGGYEEIGFSITEDLHLLQAVKKKGYSHEFVIHPVTLCETLPKDNLKSLLVQRSRWLNGVFQHLPKKYIFAITIHTSDLVLIGLLFFMMPYVAAVLLAVRFVLRYLFLQINAWQSGLKMNHLAYVIFELFFLPYNIMMILFYWFNRSIIWKSRKYKK